MSERFLPTEEWSLQQVYKERLHIKIQRWGDFVVPVLENLEDDDKNKKEKLFQWLMESVERNDRITANLIDSLDQGVREMYVYGDAFDAIKGEKNNPEHNPEFASTVQNQFLALYAIYEAGSQFAGE